MSERAAAATTHAPEGTGPDGSGPDSRPPERTGPESAAPGGRGTAPAGAGRGATGRGPTRIVRVGLPEHLRTLAEVDGEVRLEVAAPVTQRAVLDALEARFPVLRGTIRKHGTLARRPFVRYFACQRDLSHAPPDEPLPEAVAAGEEPFLVIGAMAGG